MTRRLTPLIAALALIGCRGGAASERRPPGGHPTVHELAEAFVRVANRPSEASVDALFPSDDAVARAISCQGEPPGPAVAELHEARELARSKMARAGDMSFELVSLDESGEDRIRMMKPGDSMDDCRALTSIEVRKVTLHFRATKSGETEDAHQDIRAVRFGAGGWYLQEL